MRKLLFLAFLLPGFVTPVEALETLRVAPDLGVQLEFSPEQWVLSDRAPDFLLAETAEHLEHELEAQGKEATDEQLRQIAGKRMEANEAFLYNPETGAVLTIDFSPLRAGEGAPGRRSVANSAKYAAESLEQEEGVSELEHEVTRARVAGARHAYRIDARYRQHGETKEFVGVIGFVQPYWFFLYYNDPLRNPGDKQAMNRILESVRLVPGAGK